jgi:hypothetical protein
MARSYEASRRRGNGFLRPLGIRHPPRHSIEADNSTRIWHRPRIENLLGRLTRNSLHSHRGYDIEAGESWVLQPQFWRLLLQPLPPENPGQCIFHC